MVYQNLFGEFKLEMLQLLTITSLLELIELVLKFILTNLQVGMVRKLRNNLVISMVVLMWLLQMDAELLLCLELTMEFWSVKSTWTYVNK